MRLSRDTIENEKSCGCPSGLRQAAHRVKREEGKEKGRVAVCVCDVGGARVDSMGMDSMGFGSMEMECKGMDSIMHGV